MSKVIYPAQFQLSSNDDGIWTVGDVVSVAGRFYLATSKMWINERCAGYAREYVDIFHEVSVEYLGTNPELLRTAWNTRFPHDQFSESNLPPCRFCEVPPDPHHLQRRTVLRDWLNLTETLIYEGAA